LTGTTTQTLVVTSGIYQLSFDGAIFSGSLLRGVDDGFYGEAIRDLNRRGVPSVLDAEGPPLRHGTEAEPFLVSPNQREAESLAGQEFRDDEDFRMALDTIAEIGARNVLISQESGCFCRFREERNVRYFGAEPPRVEPVSSVGAGDVRGRRVFARIGAGIQMMPNSMKVLRGIGIEERLRKTSFAPYSHLNRDGYTGELTRELLMPESLIELSLLLRSGRDIHHRHHDRLTTARSRFTSLATRDFEPALRVETRLGLVCHERSRLLAPQSGVNGDLQSIRRYVFNEMDQIIPDGGAVNPQKLSCFAIEQ